MAIMHMITLHTNGSGNPLGLAANTDRLPMHPYFLFKDLVTIIAFFGAITAIVMYAPNVLGHSDNYIPANPISTPSSINHIPYHLLTPCSYYVCKRFFIRYPPTLAAPTPGGGGK